MPYVVAGKLGGVNISINIEKGSVVLTENSGGGESAQITTFDLRVRDDINGESAELQFEEFVCPEAGEPPPPFKARLHPKDGELRFQLADGEIIVRGR
ncbi:hypothetical protein ACFL2C_03940 [Patescibacteria group bacterium]